MTLNRLVKSVRFTGDIGVVGVYIPQDPGGPDELAKRGEVAFDFGEFWFRGQTMGSGQCPVKRHNRPRRLHRDVARRAAHGARHRGHRMPPRPAATEPVGPALPGRRAGDVGRLPGSRGDSRGIGRGTDRGGTPRRLPRVALGRRDPPSAPARRALGRLAPRLARALDPMRSLAVAASLVQGATAGLVLWADGESAMPPGLADHPLLAVGSAVTAVARAAIRAGRSYCSFLGPVGGRHAPGGHLRVTVLACSEPVPLHLVGLVLLSSPGDLRGLTPRELEILGLLVDGGSNGEIARTLVVAQRTVAAHLEHILAKLSAPSRTLAAVRAERAGVYVPCRPAAARRR